MGRDGEGGGLDTEKDTLAEACFMIDPLKSSGP